MKVTFIAHAGVSIKDEGGELLIDPWFTDSSTRNPLIRSVWGGHATIDFQIPRTSDKPENHLPEAVLVSHFHTHHSPAEDIFALASRADAMMFGHPDMGEKNTLVRAAFDPYPYVSVRAFKNKEAVTRGPFSIKGISHTAPRHIAWLVTTSHGTVLHIADPVLHRDRKVREMDSVWTDQFGALKPDILFINAGGNSLRQEKEGYRFIIESGAVSPVEAAQIVAAIQPRAVSLIGCYNHSVWRNREEYIPPAPQVEEEFYWALSWLAPSVKFVPLKPGHSYGVRNQALSGTVDTYLS